MTLPWDAVARLRLVAPRLRRGRRRAEALLAALGSPGPRHDPVVSGALEHDLVLTLARLFDRPGFRLDKERKVSFPVASALLAVDGVVERLIDEAGRRSQGRGIDEDHAREAAAAIARFGRGVAAVAEGESGARLTLLRHIRDKRLAHDVLTGDEPRRLSVDELEGLVVAASELASDLAVAVDGSV